MESTVQLVPHTGFRWASIQNSAIQRLVAVELIRECERLGLPDESVQTLKEISTATGDVMLESAASRLTLYVDISSLVFMVNNKNESDYRKLAMQYMIQRQAHYSMMRRLFGISKRTFTELRAANPTLLAKDKPRVILNKDVQRVYEEWHLVCRKYDRETDAWIMMAQRLPEYPLSSLYGLIYCEPGAQEPKAFLMPPPLTPLSTVEAS
jgi:hypothetical protein